MLENINEEKVYLKDIIVCCSYFWMIFNVDLLVKIVWR